MREPSQWQEKEVSDWNEKEVKKNFIAHILVLFQLLK
jgi:hypothetical protein